MTHPDESAHSKLMHAIDEIRQNFVDQLETRILDLEALRQMVIKGDRSQDALAEIISRAHKIRGVATTLNFPALGEAAARLEDTFHDLSQSVRLSFAEKWAVLDPFLEALLTQMENALDA